MTFAYDGAGRRTRLTLPNGISTEYTYDAASRLTGLTYTRGVTVLGTLAYTYDGSAKRTRTTGTWARTSLPPAVASATYNAANRQLAFAGQALAYDPSGSLIYSRRDRGAGPPMAEVKEGTDCTCRVHFALR